MPDSPRERVRCGCYGCHPFHPDGIAGKASRERPPHLQAGGTQAPLLAPCGVNVYNHRERPTSRPRPHAASFLSAIARAESVRDRIPISDIDRRNRQPGAIPSPRNSSAALAAPGSEYLRGNGATCATMAGTPGLRDKL